MINVCTQTSGITLQKTCTPQDKKKLYTPGASTNTVLNFIFSNKITFNTYYNNMSLTTHLIYHASAKVSVV